jgi:integrase
VFVVTTPATWQLRGYRRAFQRACTLAEVKGACVHDLRRTAVSNMASLGVSRSTLGQVLNHAHRSVTAVYDRYPYDAEKRVAWELWAGHMLSTVT